ncbi:MAG: hypothetical protein M3Q86_01065 [Verrucomicrobiota bacterium]|nr:hypothetical protein [Verrucomicrobiota bacterium]
MSKKIICLFMAASATGAMLLFAQEGAITSEGKLVLDKKTYALKRALAYETTIDAEDAIAVVLSGQPITNEKLEEARDAEKDDRDGDFGRPFLKLVFTKAGQLKFWSAAAGGSMLGRSSGKATGELKVQGDRVKGAARQPTEDAGIFAAGFDARFDIALLQAGQALPPSTAKKYGPAAKVKPMVTGIFSGNGKDGKLAYVSANWSEPFAGRPGIELVFTEKDHAKEKKPDTGAMFGKFGSALIISLHEDGGIYGCHVVHSAHQNKSFSSIGRMETTEFSYADGKVEGELTTHGEVDTFGEKWEVKIKFLAPLGEIPKEFQVAEEKKPEKKTKPAPAAEDDDLDLGDMGDDEPAGEPAAAGLSVKELALTKDATGVEYQAMVEHVLFQSPSPVKKVCAELAANLKAQGWAGDGPDMVNAQSSILKRKRGEAALTIFVKPQGSGSEVKVFTEGLAWDEE